MKNIVCGSLWICLIIGFVSCKQEKSIAQNDIMLTNTAAIDLVDKPITINRNDILNIPETDMYPLILSKTGDTIPAQLDDVDGDKQWDELFFVVNMDAKETVTYSLGWVDKQPDYDIKTSVRFGKRSSADEPVKPATEETIKPKELPKSLGFQKYQTDGPMWENDKVGFRHYLDGRNAKDLFGKKVASISPETVGLDAKNAVVDNYHVMENWGRDVLSVGNSLGIGGYGLLYNDELLRLGVTVNDSVNNIEKTHFKVAAEGPVRSILSYEYTDWKPAANSKTYSVNETTTIWPGMYGYQNSVTFTGLDGEENMVVGLVNIDNDSPLEELYENDEYVILYTHDKQTYEKEWWLGLALILPRNVYLGYMEAPKTGQLSKTFLAKLKVENLKPINYYAVACWELSDERFKEKEYFKNYVKNLANQLAVKVDVVIK